MLSRVMARSTRTPARDISAHSTLPKYEFRPEVPFLRAKALTSASAHVASRPRTLAVSGIRFAGLWPIAAPCGFLVVGALIGYSATLDQPVAVQRLLGIIAACALAIAAMLALRRISNPT